LNSCVLERFPNLGGFEVVPGRYVLDGLPADVQDVEANQPESFAAISLLEKLSRRVRD
jgi:hypothetical protein